MSLDAKAKLAPIARDVSRELRRDSTKSEEIFWSRLRDRKFLELKFRRQHALFVDDNGKETFYVADFYCHEENLVVELDGGIHIKQHEMDVRRETVTKRNGTRLIRFNNQEVEKNIDGVLQVLEIFINSNPLTLTLSQKERESSRSTK